MKKVIYSYIRNDDTRHIVDYLHKKHNWSPVCFNGTDNMSRWVDENYKEAKLVDSTSIRQGFFDYSGLGEQCPIDATIINNLSKYELNYLSWLLLQDTSGWNFSFNERRRYYYDVLKYWNTIIQKKKPDIFIAYTWPHVPSDFALYLLCKYHYKIPILFLDIVPHFDNYYYSIGSNLENLSEPFAKNYNSNESDHISQDVIIYLDRIRSDSPNIPKHVSKYYDYLKSRSRNKYKVFLYLIASFFTGSVFARKQAFKKNRKEFGTKKALLNGVEEYFFWKKLSRKNKFLKNIYQSYCSTPLDGEKYIYFAAPYQPEAISNINQGPYEDPFLILDILSNVIPKDWVIYYKEHPAIFKDLNMGALCRDDLFYKKLSKYPNVKVISVDIDTFSLIDNSISVATVGGTVGWESIVRGKTALIFGTIWYQNCDGAFLITSLESATSAVNQIINGYEPNIQKVNKYAQSIFMACEKDIVTMTGYDEKINSCSNPKYEMERVARMFIEAEKRLY